MTTAQSPVHLLKAQAERMAKALKAAERGEKIANDPGGKIAEARRAKDSITFAVAMDDKILKIEMSWATIRETSEASISQYIIARMREATGAVQ